MNIRIIDAQDVASLLSMADCIKAMETAMTSATQSRLSMPPRTIMPLFDQSGFLGVMPGSLMDPQVYGAKVVSLHPSNAAKGLPTIQGFVALFDHETGSPVALVDGAAVTALRTAAASGLATRLLAREDASSLGLFGTGVQSAAHLEAICAVREIREVRVWGRSEGKVREFVETHAAKTRARIEGVTDPRDAGACDIVCTVTEAKQPILLGEWLKPGAHINLVGAHSPVAREADSAVIARARVFVDSLESAWNEAGDLLIPIKEGVISREDVLGEIGAVLLGRLPGRVSADDVTLYKSLGVVAQDLVAAQVVFAKATAKKGAR